MVKHYSRLRRWLAAHLPNTPLLRIPVGILLIFCGILGFLPVLGFWMIPVGLAILAIDFPPARRLARRLLVKFGRWKNPRPRRSG